MNGQTREDDFFHESFRNLSICPQAIRLLNKQIRCGTGGPADVKQG
jgi:hypothetical protein